MGAVVRGGERGVTRPAMDGNRGAMDTQAHIKLELLSNPLYLAGARELVASVARRLGFSEISCAQIALAVDEALCNVIRHGYEGDQGRPIWISIWPIEAEGEDGEPGLRLVIEDEAPHVDPEHMKGRDLDDIRPGGLGVHIIREVMDDVSYEKRAPGGMRLTLTKVGDVQPSGDTSSDVDDSD